MARPIKYNWEAIKKAYEQGADIDEICSTYNVTKKTLQNKVSEKKWIVTGTLNSDINEFQEVLGKVTQNATNHPETTAIYAQRMHEAYKQKISTIIEDSSIIKENRKLFMELQSVISKGIENGDVDVDNVKDMTVALKNIETTIKPQTQKAEFNLQQDSNGNLSANVKLSEDIDNDTAIAEYLKILNDG